jgi:hypothetical protein
MEYIFDAKVSYCATDGIRDRNHRRNLGWVNDYSHDELLRLLGDVGFFVQRSDRIDNVQWLFRLQPDVPAVPAVKKVAVLSYYNVGNFGDWLGYHLVNDSLPRSCGSNASVVQALDSTRSGLRSSYPWHRKQHFWLNAQ